MYFPVYSGKHKGVWNQCIECHTNPGDFKQNSCTVCHINPETNDQHKMVSGYYYQSDACLACHPTGDADVKFDHNSTMFPLTGAHKIARNVTVKDSKEQAHYVWIVTKRILISLKIQSILI